MLLLCLIAFRSNGSAPLLEFRALGWNRRAVYMKFSPVLLLNKMSGLDGYAKHLKKESAP